MSAPGGDGLRAIPEWSGGRQVVFGLLGHDGYGHTGGFAGREWRTWEFSTTKRTVVPASVRIVYPRWDFAAPDFSLGER